LRRTKEYASFLLIARALQLHIFEQPDARVDNAFELIFLNTISTRTPTVRPEPVEGPNGSYIARQTRSWFDKLTTNGFSLCKGYSKQEYVLMHRYRNRHFVSFVGFSISTLIAIPIPMKKGAGVPTAICGGA
jgi:hypothetical protein